VLLVSALTFLCGNAFVLKRNYDNEWRATQSRYLEMVVERTDDPQMKAIIEARSPRIDQIVIRDWGEEHVDRCATCHTGADDARFADAEQPFRTHPPVPGEHPFGTFGCTVCHQGNGRGLSAKDAHGRGGHWKEPILVGKFVEAGCAKCHPAPYLEETPLLRKGAGLFVTQGCYGCHKVSGVSRGKLGVELTEVGAKWSIEYLRESLLDPKANNIESIMPAMELEEDETEALLVYLKSLTGENLVIGPVAHHNAMEVWKEALPEEVEVSVESGAALFGKMACNACHTVNGVGGKIGPDLSVYGLQRTREWMIEHHIAPRILIGGSIMPDFDYSESQLEALALYLESLQSLEVDNAAIYAAEGSS
jgi:mono/diheme cytochrome c family protein